MTSPLPGRPAPPVARSVLGGTQDDPFGLDAAGNFRELVTSATDWLAQVQVAPDGQRLAWLRTSHDCPPWKLELRWR